MTRFLSLCLWLVPFVAPARAHEGHEHETCAPGELCDLAATLGFWGLIALGLLFFLVAFLPYREAGEGRGFGLLRKLRARAETETAAWRRLLWPVLGLLFIAFGVANLVGWR